MQRDNDSTKESPSSSLNVPSRTADTAPKEEEDGGDGGQADVPLEWRRKEKAGRKMRRGGVRSVMR